MKQIKMAHKDSDVEITVVASQVPNAIYNGWYEVSQPIEPEQGAKQIKKSTKRNRNGKS